MVGKKETRSRRGGSGGPRSELGPDSSRVGNASLSRA